MVIVDTSVIIDFLRSPHREKSWFYSLQSSQEVALPLIVHTEIYSGKSIWENPTNRAEADLLISTTTLLAYSAQISILAGQLKAEFGLTITDAILAATSIVYSSPLATLNTKHFSPIPHLTLLPRKLHPL
ncbi:PIN domain-containing protein [Candidatus Amesbacteria bacterium]|nr:PIN domain-containing protein [Candidatus Amesbacteria bacterium]